MAAAARVAFGEKKEGKRGAGKLFGPAAFPAAPFRGRLWNPKTNHIAPLQRSNGKVADRDRGFAQRLWGLAAARCARELEKGVENAHPRAPRRRPAGARIRCDKFRRIRRARSAGSRRGATEFK